MARLSNAFSAREKPKSHRKLAKRNGAKVKRKEIANATEIEKGQKSKERGAKGKE